VLKRWLIAAAALVVSGAVSATLLIAANPARDAVEAIAAAHDVPAGSTLGADALALVRLDLAASRSLFFTRADEAAVSGLRATHDLMSGQLIQRSDVTSLDSSTDRRLVFVPVKDVPPAAPGSRVDLLVVTGPSDHPTVQPFAIGIEVRSSTAAGLVLVVPAGRAAAFVYAGTAMQLAAVMAEPGSTQGAEVPVSTDQQAIEVASGT
jgi:SAF domain-containing protein